MVQDEVRSFDELGLDDVPEVGGKNASLGELRRALTPLGVRTAPGFATTAEAFRRFVAHNGLAAVVREQLDGLEVEDLPALRRAGARLRDAFVGGTWPEGMAEAVANAYRELGGDEAEVDVAVRSSATAEDLPHASFAGQQETYLNVRGEAAVLESVRRCFASLFTDRAIAYRIAQGFEHTQVALSAGVQRMVRADLGAAGVMFTLDPESGFRDVVLIDGTYGLGESVVRGVVSPDEWLVFKPTLSQGKRPILRRHLGEKAMKLVYDRRGGTRRTRNVPVPLGDRQRFCLSDDDVLQLARWGMVIEEHYSKQAGQPRPMDIEWAKDGQTGELYVLQARPETVHGAQSATAFERFALTEPPGAPLVVGQSVGRRIGAGRAKVVRGTAAADDLAEGEVLVAEMTDPDWVPLMRRAAAIVTERGGRTCHAAIVSRELGVPCVVGARGALERLDDAGEVTVDCSAGEQGAVYPGRVAFERQAAEAVADLEPAVPVQLIVGDPGQAFEWSRLPVGGVGLARMEFIIAHDVGIHPRAALEPEALEPAVSARIQRRAQGYGSPEEHVVARMSEGVARIAAAFHPRPVLVRLSDFKSNEYAHLEGGETFEPLEDNPMLGLRGAARYLDPRFAGAFALECRALRRVRDQMGLTNVHIMVPFCRTLGEADAVLARLAEHGLAKGWDELQIWVMCEIPSNAVLAEDFAARFDGLSIGSNDLTQLTLGVDRDSPDLSHLFDERDPAVRLLIELAIEGAHRQGKPVGICGQAPSDLPDFAAFLVRAGIDSISVNPDVALATIQALSAPLGEDSP